MDKVCFQLESVFTCIFFAILVQDRCEYGTVPVAVTIVPALASRFTEVFSQYCIVCSVCRIRFRFAFLIADSDAESACIPSVVVIRRNHEGNHVIGFNFHLFETEIKDIVVAVSLLRFNLLLQNLSVILINSQCDSVRPVRICVVVCELGIVSGQINLSCFLDYPLVDRTQLGSCMDVVLLHFKTCVPDGQICAAVIALLA